MHTPQRRALIGTLVAGLVASPLALGLVSPAQANPAGSDLVIKEVYGAGGNSGAVFNADFVELYNPTTAAITLSGKSVQYRSAAGGVGGTATLSGSVPAKGHFLVQMSATGATGAALPKPDLVASPAIGMAGAGGQVILGTSTTYPTGNLVGATGVIDAFGTSGATSFEGAAAGSAATATQSLNRSATGADTDSNAADFTLAAPSPTASGGTTPDPDPDPDPEPGTVRSIAEIQGAGATTPFDGQSVTTQGVVTAAYPTGGLNGFYIQTPGADTTPGASDGVFVYGGTTGFSTYPAIGDSVQVVGTASEFSGATQITATNAGVTTVAALGTVVPKTEVPGTDCDLPGTACLTGSALDAAREVMEGEAVKPTAAWTATDVYDFGPYYNDATNGSAMRGEIGLAADSDKPLVAPTEVIDAQDTAAKNARIAYNNAHRIVLDDASSLTYSTTANSDKAFPWVTKDHAVRVGAAVSFPAPVIFTIGFNQWRLVPTTQVSGAPSATQPQFEQTREDNLAPQDVGGDVQLATFNVLNFFPTTGDEYVAAGLGTCTFYSDRAGNKISNNQCNPNGPRGAANDANLTRQRDKIVAAINGADADVVSLEELENSVKFNKDRDFAINALVTALNADAGAGTWAAVPSPAASELPALADQDVIRNGFIYKPAKVALVGTSDVLSELSSGNDAFSDAREPVAQAFKKVGSTDAQAFAVIANHFKSKGSGTPDPDGQGNANDRRVLQAKALVTFADQVKAAKNLTRVFLTGDFNAYSEEDPIQVLTAAGYTNLESTSDPEEESYNFDGQIGSLDHVLANDAALADVNAVDIWTINSYESVYYEYARYNTNVTNLYAANPFRSSDHNPEIVGINVAEPAGPVDVQILATNDFHGRIQNDTTSGSAGAAVLAGAVKQFKAANPATSFVAAGDLIGASTFESFIQNDEPTIDALNEAGLDVSAVGNHEFDKGYDDLVNRVMDRAEWTYIGANVKMRASGDPALDPSFVMDQGGIEVGYVGAVTEHLPELVAPGGIADIQVTNIANAVNAEADALKADGVDVIVLLVHEGAAGTDCDTINSDTTSDFGKITSAVNGNVDAIISGHTHLVYNCSQPVPSWSGRPVTTRPIVSAGQYGTNLNKINFSVDATTGVVQAKTQAVLPLKAGTTGSTFNYPVDSNTQTIVNTAVSKAEVLGAEVIGQIGGAYNRAKLADGTTENRGGESTLGNLVAEIQRQQTSGANRGGAQIAFMNPGGLRADLAGTVNGASRDVTYKQAANVQPFANTLVNEALTGAQIKEALEQQWQPTGASRPFLKLGISKGFRYTYDPAAAQGSRVKTMSLNGAPIVLTDTYSVTVNSFLATGGDNFAALNGKARKQDTGVTDLQAQVDYFDAQTAPLAVDYSQRGVGVSIPSGAPETYPAGATVTINLSSLSMTGPGDVQDANVTATIDGQSVGTFPVTTTRQTALPGFDEVGTATAEVTLPAKLAAGTHEIVFTGDKTGTVVEVPIKVEGPASVGTTTSATAADVVYGKAGSVEVTVTATGTDVEPTGKVELRDGETVLGTGTLVDGKATIALEARSLEVGTHPLTVSYVGDEGFDPSTAEVTVTVVKANAVISVTVSPTSVTVLRSRNTVTATVAADGYTPTGTVEIRRGSTVLGTGELNSQGRVAVRVGPYGSVGTATLTVVYRGDERASSDTTTVQVKVVKQTPTLTVTTVASARKGTQPTVKVAVTGEGATVTGRASFTVGGKTVTITLVDGKAQYKLPKITKDTAVTVRYNGSTTFNPVSKRIVVKLR